MEFPERIIRGVPNTDFVDENGKVTAALFRFTDVKREDGFFEVSINWYDEEEALNCILNQTKEGGELQFKCCAAILQRSKLDLFINISNLKDVLSYERSPLVDNKFHGNLLRKDGELSKSRKNMISGGIALLTNETVPQK
jgi:hypothetical protein